MAVSTIPGGATGRANNGVVLLLLTREMSNFCHYPWSRPVNGMKRIDPSTPAILGLGDESIVAP